MAPRSSVCEFTPAEIFKLSAAGRRVGVRVPNDSYQTPPALCTAIVRKLKSDGLAYNPKRILEPSAGVGNFVSACRAELGVYPEITAIDLDNSPIALDEAGADNAYQGRFEDFAVRPAPDFDLIIGNPPFMLAKEHIDLAKNLLHSNGVLAMLLRTGFYEKPRDMATWDGLYKIYGLRERPKFVNNKTDMATYAVFVWRLGHVGPAQFEVLSWK